MTRRDDHELSHGATAKVRENAVKQDRVRVTNAIGHHPERPGFLRRTEFIGGDSYVCGYTLLNAAYYGVPQMRERLFLIGYRREIANGVTFPEATHWVDLPPGYEGSRAVALKLLCGTDATGNGVRLHLAARGG